jgi:serine/threonine protein kinase
VDPERWRHIEKLYESVVERSPAERAELLAQADPDIRREVEVLLEQPSGGAFLDQPAEDLLGESSVIQLSAGTRLGHYEIQAMLGRGGMGVVYRARDTQLGRQVAIKVLPDSLAEDPDRLARFNREAKVLASLNHPNIGQIYGVESQALVMELVEGATLRGPLPIEAVLNYARQIAEALEAAHEKGIIHRDLKPANIMVTPAGLVKVLDFGLAKAEAPLAAGDPADSPDTTLSPTRAGIILGTAAYMSPEQARGEIVDKRTDIWSFGAVLYEMLTGKRAFSGDSVTDILAGVLRGEPDWSALPSSTPLGIRKLLRRCLERDRKQRLQAIGEARIAIEESRQHARPRAWSAAVLLASVAVVVALVAVMWFVLHRPPKPPTEPTLKQLTFNSSENPVQGAAISPDGKYLAYSDPSGIHVRVLSRGEERLIPRPAGVPASTYWFVDSWFPDGTQLLGHTQEPGGHQSMWTFSVVGQSPQKLREDVSVWEVSPDGTRIAFSPLSVANDSREIWVIGSQGDNPQKVLALGENESIVIVHWSPDGKRLGYLRTQRKSDAFLASIETFDLKTASRTVVLSADRSLMDFCWLPEGRIVYARLEPPVASLWQIGIDIRVGKPLGKPDRIIQSAGARAIFVGLSATADGKRLVIINQTHQGQVYLGELAEGGTRMKVPRRLTNDEAIDYPSAWTGDSKTVLFWSSRNGKNGIYKQGINQETSEPVYTGTRDAVDAHLSSDGAWILYAEPSTTSAPDRLMRVPVSGGVPQFVLEKRRTFDTRCAVGPVSLCVVVETSQDRKQLMITAFDPIKGRGRVLRSIEVDPSQDYAGGLSPDGSTYALARSAEAQIHIRLLSLSGGSDGKITVKDWPSISNLDWSSNGKGFYCGSMSPQGGTLLYVDLKGNARALWQYKGAVPQIWGIASPDGHYVAILAEFFNSNAWMLEGF